MLFKHSNSSGTLDISAYFPVSHIPAILSEWSALFPLVCHLANYGEEHHMIGQLALTGHLTVGLFPKLGYLHGIWKLLQEGPDFLDRTNAKSESSSKVWDVNWGSVFTRSNGSAANIITDYALRKHKPALRMPEVVLTGLPSRTDAVTTTRSSVPATPTRDPPGAVFRRYQDLQIICMSRKNRGRSSQNTFFRLAVSRIGIYIYHLVLVGVVVMLCLIGAFGSAAIIINGLVSKAVCRSLRADRPSGYLENNENHAACMLSATHENATTWYLYMGDRGVIDWLLNKTMLSTPSANRFLIAYFRLAHVLQLLSMTFIAAQKGADGVSLVMLLFVNYGFQYFFGSRNMARAWLDTEQVSLDAHTFSFSGRTPMLGAIHMISEARSAEWMDTLIAPCPRIKVWLDNLQNATELSRANPMLQALSLSDRSWVSLNTYLTTEAARLIREKLRQGKATESLYVKEST